MRIVHHDQKQGNLKLEVTDPEDLLVIKRSINQNDLVRGSTERKLKVGGGEDQKAIRKRVFIEIRAEKAELETGTLRILGTITLAPEDVGKGEHHSFALVPGDIIEIQKTRWPSHVLERIHEACEAKRRVLVVAFERDLATIGILTTHGMRILHELKGESGKKQYAQAEGTFFKDLAKIIKEEYERTGADQAILASPQFWMQYVLDALDPAIRKRTVSATCSGGDSNALHEILKRPELKTVLEKERAVRESASMDELMHAISKEKAFYGIADAQDRITEGNVKSLMVSENLLFDEAAGSDAEALIEAAEGAGAKSIIITTQEKERLDSLGGIAGIKRW